MLDPKNPAYDMYFGGNQKHNTRVYQKYSHIFLKVVPDIVFCSGCTKLPLDIGYLYDGLAGLGLEFGFRVMEGYGVSLGSFSGDDGSVSKLPQTFIVLVLVLVCSFVCAALILPAYGTWYLVMMNSRDTHWCTCVGNAHTWGFPKNWDTLGSPNEKDCTIRSHIHVPFAHSHIASATRLPKPLRQVFVLKMWVFLSNPFILYS